MNWEAIGAIGEVLGALGMIVSLAYLAIQIRLNTQQIRQNIEVSRVASYNQAQEQTWQSPLAMSQSTEVVRSLAKLVEQGPDALTVEETIRLDAILGTFFHGIDSLFKLYEKGLVDPENWENIFANQMEWWSNPHMMAYLRARPGPISKRLFASIEKRFADQERAA